MKRNAALSLLAVKVSQGVKDEADPETAAAVGVAALDKPRHVNYRYLLMPMRVVR